MIFGEFGDMRGEMSEIVDFFKVCRIRQRLNPAAGYEILSDFEEGSVEGLIQW